MSQTPTTALKFSPEYTPYQAFGGEAPVRAIVDAFYDHMDLDPDYAILRALHSPTLDDARDKLFWFLSGWLGGPSLYTDRFGHPMLRARHLPFAIGSRERDQWMDCMRRALSHCAVADPLGDWLLGQLQGTADWMRNKA